MRPQAAARSLYVVNQDCLRSQNSSLMAPPSHLRETVRVVTAEPRRVHLIGVPFNSSGALGWDVTIFNPDLDPDGTSARRIVRYMADAIRR